MGRDTETAVETSLNNVSKSGRGREREVEETVNFQGTDSLHCICGGLRIEPKPVFLPLIRHLSHLYPAPNRAATPITTEHPVRSLSGEDEGDDEPVQTQHLSEDQNEDHPNEEARLLRCTPNAGISHDTDGKPCRQST